MQRTTVDKLHDGSDSSWPWLSSLSFAQPNFVETSAWLEHAPFAFWLTEQLRPRSIVELGTHGGFSYFAFCQAVEHLGLATRCYAVDTWEGDEHAGFYGPEVFERVQRHNQTHFAAFSRLVRATFADAVQHFTEGSVDLLHIDGRHFYEDVKEDFETWLPKVSTRGIVLFHDINVREKGFGVYRYWDELTERFPSFGFLHGHGLGVLAVGSDLAPEIAGLFGAWDERAVQAAYSRLGSAVSLRQDLNIQRERYEKQIIDLRSTIVERDERLSAEAADLAAARKQLASAHDLAARIETAKKELETNLERLHSRVRELEDQCRKATKRLRRTEAARRELEKQIRRVERSTSWRLTKPVRYVGDRLPRVRVFRRRAAKLVLWLRSGDFEAIGRASRARLRTAAGESARTSLAAGASTVASPATAARSTTMTVRELRRAGDLAAADDAARGAIRRGEREPALLREAAELSMVRNRWAEACHRWELVEAHPGRRARWKIIARFAEAARRDGDYAKAEALCYSGMDAYPDKEVLLRELAEIAMAQGDWPEAEDRWNRLLQEHPTGSSVGLARAGLKICRRLLSPDALRREVRRYSASRAARQTVPPPLKIAVATAIIGGYDPVHLPLQLEPDVDYVMFADRAVASLGVFDVRPIEYHDEDPTRVARFIKTHLHQLLSGYDVVIWVDSNVLAVGGVRSLADRVQASGQPLGAIPHPLRDTLWAEADACLLRGKDDSRAIRAQVERYRREEVGAHDLIESNLLVMDLRGHRLDSMLATWWGEIDRGSRRDQLSFAYAVAQHRVGWHPLMARPTSLRDHADFALLDHGSWAGAATAIGDVLAGESGRRNDLPGPFLQVRQSRLDAVRLRTVDIVVCVHNAMHDVRACLDSIERTRRPEVHRLIVVDDGSDEETAAFLGARIAQAPNSTLCRNEEATGYTRAANLGLSVSRAELVVLLNSDTIVTENWLEKLADAVFSTPGAGIVGPLSNAASHQSIPNHASTPTQTAVNALPAGHDPESMNTLCEQWSSSGPLPRVPLLHGFCFGIAREAIETLGGFDEQAFPHGYGEENDFCFRAVDAGIGLVVATNTFVFHAKSSSYDSERRIGLMRDGGAQLRRLHGKERIDRAVRSMQGNPALMDLRRRAWRLYQDELPRDRPVKLTALVQSSASGYPTSSAYVRLIQPAAAIPGEIRLRLAESTADAMASPGDVVIVQRTAVHSREEADALVARIREVGARLVVDVDDGLALIPPKDNSGEAYARGNGVLERILKQADAGWFSTPSVAALYKHLNHDVFVIPNGIDPSLWQIPAAEAPWNPDGTTRLLFMGTFTHRSGLGLLLPALDRLYATKPGSFDLTVVGVAKDVPHRPWLHRLGIPDGCNEYPQYVSWLRGCGQFDVGLAPLVDDAFTRCKSDLKLLDYTGLGLLTVASHVPPFAALHAHEDRMVLVENTIDDWFEQLRRILDDPAPYAERVRRARSYVKQERTTDSSSAVLLRSIRALDAC